jgi:gag-polypeptide of LTR copia-type
MTEEKTFRPFKIEPKLKGQEGFPLWKYKLASRLDTMEMWDASGDVPIENPIAKDSIVASLADEVLELVLDQSTTLGIWTKIKAEFAAKSVTRRIRSLNELVNFTFNATDHETMKQGFAKLANCERNLLSYTKEKTIGISELVSVMCLAALPPAFDGVRVIVEQEMEATSTNATATGTKETAIRLEDIRARILAESDRRATLKNEPAALIKTAAAQRTIMATSATLRSAGTATPRRTAASFARD